MVSEELPLKIQGLKTIPASGESDTSENMLENKIGNVQEFYFVKVLEKLTTF